MSSIWVYLVNTQEALTPDEGPVVENRLRDLDIKMTRA